MARNEGICSICLNKLEKEKASVLTMGHYGNPRFLCPECEALIEDALKSHDIKASEAAMKRLGNTVSANGADDDAVVDAVKEIFKTASERNEKIKEGTYDFSLDDAEEDGGFDEIPEELLETEEDREETEREEETNRKFGKILDIITAVIFVAAAAIFVFYLVKKL